MRTGAIMDIHPAHSDQGLPDAVPVAGTGDDLDVSADAPIPGHYEACPASRLRNHLPRGGQFPPFHARAADRAAQAGWWRLVQGGIPITLAHQGEVTTVLLAKSRALARAVARVAHEMVSPNLMPRGRTRILYPPKLGGRVPGEPLI
jgi:hypothetical protein